MGITSKDIDACIKLQGRIKALYDRDVIVGINQDEVHLCHESMESIMRDGQTLYDAKLSGIEAYPVEVTFTLNGVRFIGLFDWQTIFDNDLLRILPITVGDAAKLYQARKTEA